MGRKPKVASPIGEKYMEILAPVVEDFAGRRRVGKRTMGPMVEIRAKELISHMRRKKVG